MEGRRTAFALTLIILVSFAVYFNSLFGEFVYDDASQIVDNPWIKDIRRIPDLFLKDVWAFRSAMLGLSFHEPSNYYRPLMGLNYMLDYRIFGLRPWGFHLNNVVMHAAVSVVVFLLLRELLRLSGAGRPLDIAFAAAVLFAVHPIHTEAVAWLGCIPETTFTLFYLLSLLFYIRGRPLVSAGFFFVSVLYKETALTLPLLLVAYDVLFRERPGRFSPSVLGRYLPYAAIIAVYLLLRVNAIGGFAAVKRHAYLSNWQYFINVFPLFAGYIGKLILPVKLNAHYIFHPVYSIYELKGIVSLLFTLAVAVAAFGLRRERPALLGFLLMLIGLLPVLYIPALGENTFAERYLYLPSVGFVLIVSVFPAGLSRMGRAALLVFVSVAVVYSLQTVRRNFVWKNNFTLWSDTVLKSSDSYIAHGEIGLAYHERGQIDEAVKHYKASIDLRPNYEPYHNNLGNAYMQMGLYDAAIRHYSLSIAINPYALESYYNISLAYRAKGWDAMADEYLRKLEGLRAPPQ